MDVEKLIKTIIDSAYNVRLQLGPGFLESVYKNALVLELAKQGVAKTVIVELKAVNNLMSAHEVQLVNYLTATQVDNGLLINFGAPKLEIKRKYRLYRK